jgi:hypothetical protein
MHANANTSGKGFQVSFNACEVSIASSIIAAATNASNISNATGALLFVHCVSQVKRSADMFSLTCCRLALIFFFFEAIKPPLLYRDFFLLS